MRRLVAVFLFAVAPLCLAQQPDAHRIMYGETVSITVAGEPELSGMVTVRPDGEVTLPLVNNVRAAGLTFGQLRRLLESRLQAFVKNPRVTIAAGVPTTRRFEIAPREAQPWLLPDVWPIR